MNDLNPRPIMSQALGYEAAMAFFGCGLAA